MSLIYEPIHTKLFVYFFVMRKAEEWNALPTSVFPDSIYPNVRLLKAKVNRHFLEKRVPLSVTSGDIVTKKLS